MNHRNGMTDGLDRAALLIIVFSLFIFFLAGYSVNGPLVYDEQAYANYARQILIHGPAGTLIADRVYAFPVVIAVMMKLFGSEPSTLRFSVGILQLGILLASAWWLTERARRAVNGTPFARNVAFALVVWNPYLLIACHLVLTDVAAACIAVCGLVLAVSAAPRSRGMLIAFGLLALATMIRSTAVVFLAIGVATAIFRVACSGGLRATVSTAIGATVIVGAIAAPQIAMNRWQANRWTPFSVLPVYQMQSLNSVRFLRYETVVEPGVAPQRFTLNPLPAREVYGKPPTIFQAIESSPEAAFVALAGHVLALFDWDRPSTYVSCTECQFGRVGATFALAMLWLLAGLGAFVVMQRRPRSIDVVAVGAATFGYIALMSTTIVEARFGYPLAFLAALAAVPGVDAIRRSRPWGMAAALAAWVMLSALLVGVAWYFDSKVAPATVYMPPAWDIQR